MESLVEISGWLAGFFIVLNFLTCWVMPWSKEKCPWKGSRPGPDPKDKLGYFMLCKTHRWWAWLAIIFVGVHLVLVVSG